MPCWWPQAEPSDAGARTRLCVRAMKADMDRRTARKYIEVGKCPAELQAKHTWRTRPDPLEAVWPEVTRMLYDAPELEAKTLVEHFLARADSGLEENHLRTFFRQVRHWCSVPRFFRGLFPFGFRLKREAVAESRVVVMSS